MQISAECDVPGDLMPKMARQVPYAAMLALNASAFDARDAVKAELPKRFKLKNSFTASRILVDKASRSSLVAHVTAPDYMGKQEDGGTVKPLGKHLAAPELLRGKILRKAQRPKAALDREGVFILKRGSRRSIAQKRGKTLKILFWMTGTQQFDKRFDMRLTVEKAVHQHFPTRFAQAWAKATATAR